MRRRDARRDRAARGLPVLMLLAFLLAGCERKGPGDPAERVLLIQLNTSHNNGRTVRWPDGPIRVFLNNIGAEDEVTEWTSVSHGKVTFFFVGSASEATLTFGFTNQDDICGVTNVEFDDDGKIDSAEIKVVQSVYRTSDCQRTVTHEMGHAIGILGHTSDGGLMDPDGGDGHITGDVAELIRNLYALSPGTFIAPEGRRQARRRPNGRNVITIVDPVRR